MECLRQLADDESRPMSAESLTDEKIGELLLMPKRVTNPNSKWREKPGHNERNFTVESVDSTHHFVLYVRQNRNLEDDFSCGLSWLAPSGETITLARYNGSSHSHPNHIEKQKLGFVCHIHKATERYIRAGKKIEGYAEDASRRYNSVKGALACLVSDCAIKGIITEPDHPDLFK